MAGGWIAGRRWVAATAAAVCVTASLACAPTPRRVYVPVGPPAPIHEVRTSAPGPRYVWIAGYHRWNGRSYVWVPGRWALPPAARRVWVPAHWQHDRRGWFFVDGRWR
jgi:hypothetical protein